VVGGLAVLVVTPVAAQARADSLSPLTELADAAAQRLQLAEPVAAFKWSAHGAIEDPGRVQQELATLGADATAKRIDPDYPAYVSPGLRGPDQRDRGHRIQPVRGLEAQPGQRAGCCAGPVGVAVDD